MNTDVTTIGTSVWNVDPAHSAVEFSVKHMMITTVRGGFTEFSGTVNVDEEDGAASAVEVSIAAASVDTRTGARDDHLRSADFFDAENHPALLFRSTRVEGGHQEAGDTFRVHGDLTIRGVTRAVVLEAEVEGSGVDPWGGNRISFSASTRIDRRDFGLTWNQGLEAGGVLVSNEVRISLFLQVVRAD